MNNSSPYAFDTSADAEAVQLELIRAMTPNERVRRSLGLTSQMLRFAKESIRREYPQMNEEKVGLEFIRLHYGESLAGEVARFLASRQL